MFVGQVGIRGAGKVLGERGIHRHYDIFLPQEAVPAAGSEICPPKLRNARQSLNLAPELGLGLGVEHVQLEFTHALKGSARLQLIENGEGVNLPHRRLCPKPVELQVEFSISHCEPIAREAEAVSQPVQEIRLEDAATAEERVA